MPDRKPREKVVAEITLAHLTQFAHQMGRSLTSEEALDFLNQNGRAYEMWKRMMQAGEDYIKSSLQMRTPPVVACPSSRRGPIAVQMIEAWGLPRPKAGAAASPP